MTPDLINGLFEATGAIMLACNVWRLHRDKHIKGVHWAGSVFFTTWGVWNLFYYPNLEQWCSLAGGALLAAANAVWLVQLIYYSRRQPCASS